VRDYAAEYARRKAREAERAAAEGRAFDLAKARGHVTRDYEREQARVRREVKRELPKELAPGKRQLPKVDVLQYWIDKTRFGADDYDAKVRDGVERKGGDSAARAWMVARLKEKYEDTMEFLARVGQNMTYKEAAKGSTGQAHYFTGRVEFVAVEVYWYHGGQ